MKRKPYHFDCVHNVLIISKNFLNEAGLYNSTAYKTLKSIRKENPGLIVSVKQRKSPKKNVYANLTIKAMKQYLEKARNSDSLIKQLDAVVATSVGQRHPLKYIREWFLETYPLYTKAPRFDEDGYLIVEQVQTHSSD